MTVLATVAGCAGAAGTPPAATRATASSAPASASGPTTAPTGEAVYRDFIAAVNAGDAEEAARLLADDARIYEAPVGDDAVTKVRSLRCTAEIRSITPRGDTLTVDFEITGRAQWGSGACPRGTERAVVTVRNGKIAAIDPAP